jgi:hypothetical protein
MGLTNIKFYFIYHQIQPKCISVILALHVSANCHLQIFRDNAIKVVLLLSRCPWRWQLFETCRALRTLIDNNYTFIMHAFRLYPVIKNEILTLGHTGMDDRAFVKYNLTGREFLQTHDSSRPLFKPSPLSLLQATLTSSPLSHSYFQRPLLLLRHVPHRAWDCDSDVTVLKQVRGRILGLLCQVAMWPCFFSINRPPPRRFVRPPSMDEFPPPARLVASFCEKWDQVLLFKRDTASSVFVFQLCLFLPSLSRPLS